MNNNNYVITNFSVAQSTLYGYGIPCSDNIVALDHDECFVFGSNLKGRHGAGAALLAKNKFGARIGTGRGPSGQTYAIPTKNEKMDVLFIKDIKKYISEFILYAKVNPNVHFLVTKIGCGLAGYGVRDIAPLFSGARYVTNIHLSADFVNFLTDPHSGV
jgi:hypothetical protein